MNQRRKPLQVHRNLVQAAAAVYNVMAGALKRITAAKGNQQGTKAHKEKGTHAHAPTTHRHKQRHRHKHRHTTIHLLELQ